MPPRAPAAALCCLLFAAPAAAQKTADQARLLFGLGVGYVGNGELWAVGSQPAFDGPIADTLALSRRLTSGLGIRFYGVYFPGDHFGVTGEAYLLGLGVEDACRLTFATGSVRNQEACSTINGSRHGGDAVALTAGVVYRVASHQVFSPYLHANAGISIRQSTTIETRGETTAGGTAEPAFVFIYTDPNPKSVTGYFSLGGGVTAAVARGYQLRLEARDNIVGLQRVLGAANRDGLTPSRATRFQHVFSVNLGFEVILERKRGRRY